MWMWNMPRKNGMFRYWRKQEGQRNILDSKKGKQLPFITKTLRAIYELVVEKVLVTKSWVLHFAKSENLLAFCCTSRPPNLQKSRNFSNKFGCCLWTSFDFKAILNLE